MSDLEVFPHKRNWVATNFQTGHVNRGVTPYRFVEIVTAPGWRCYPGQQCHEGKDGLLIEDSPARWEEQDLWGAHNGDYTLDIGCYGTEEYICYAWAPTWWTTLLERISFPQAEGAAQWAMAWMKDPRAAARAPVPHGATLEVWARPNYRG